MHYIHLTQALPGVPSGLSNMLHVIIVTKVTVIVFKSAKRKKIFHNPTGSYIIAVKELVGLFLDLFLKLLYTHIRILHNWNHIVCSLVDPFLVAVEYNRLRLIVDHLVFLF